MTRRTSRLRIIFSRDTLVGLAVVLLAAALCVGLGFWQFGRFEHKRDVADTVAAHYDAEPVALGTVLPTAGAALAPADDWTPVEVRGEYCTDPGCVQYVRNRQLSGEVGFWQLVPLRTDDGFELLVVRGWVGSQSEASAPLESPPIPDGEVTVTVRMRPAEPVLDREIPAGQVHSVNPPQIEGILPETGSTMVTGAYGELVTEDPDGPRPAALPAPDTSLGPHLSYAFQWWIFALFFPAALIYRTRRTILDHEAEEHAEGDGDGDTVHPHEPTDHRPRREVRTRRRSQDEEEEDALIDQQDH
jgi:cytochrome oxidase assembly protein ShyY1